MNDHLPKLSPKALACLRMARALHGDMPYLRKPYPQPRDSSEVTLAHRDEWRRLYSEACATFSQRAVECKFAELAERGYLEYGVSVRNGWLTEKGHAALEFNESEAARPEQVEGERQ